MTVFQCTACRCRVTASPTGGAFKEMHERNPVIHGQPVEWVPLEEEPLTIEQMILRRLGVEP